MTTRTKGSRPASACILAVGTRLGWIALLEESGTLTRSVLPAKTKRRALELLDAPAGAVEGGSPVLARAAEFLIGYYDTDAKRTPPASLLVALGNDFRGRVYRELAKVPAGRVVTYGELAKRAGCAGASRAVGTAMAKNRLAPLVPCHRVVRSDGSLGGYSGEGGPALKRELLEWEGVAFDKSGRVVRS